MDQSPEEPSTRRMSIQELGENEKQDLMGTLMSRIIEDILTFSMVEAMAYPIEDRNAIQLIEAFFKKYDLRVLTLGNYQKSLTEIGTSARRML